MTTTNSFANHRKIFNRLSELEFVRQTFLEPPIACNPESLKSTYGEERINQLLLKGVKTENVQLVKETLASGANPNFVETYTNGQTPLDVARAALAQPGQQPNCKS